MPLLSLDTRDLRLFKNVSLNFSRQLNVFYGENASGKTTLLEAVMLLSTAKSFRTRNLQELIRYSQAEFLVSGKVETQSGLIVPLGLRKNAAGLEMRAAGKAAKKTSDMAGFLPTQLMHPDSHLLLSGGPKERRRFLDWGVFHVEPAFLPVWRRYDKVLRQRNAALKQRSGTRVEKSWESALEETAKAIHAQRSKYVNELNEVLPTFAAAIAGENQFTVDYLPGWDTSRALVDQLEEHLEKDRGMGFTYYGPHRSDLVLRFNQRRAQKFVSRGQQKMLVLALKLSQAEIFTQHTGRPCLILLDDLTAELDQYHREQLLKVLNKMLVQLFISCTDKEAIKPDLWADIKMFHVKQGQVEEVV